MNTSSMILKLSTSMLRAQAMCEAGISPRALAMKPGTRVERNRRAESRRGHQKHKSRHWD